METSIESADVRVRPRELDPLYAGLSPCRHEVSIRTDIKGCFPENPATRISTGPSGMEPLSALLSFFGPRDAIAVGAFKWCGVDVNRRCQSCGSVSRSLWPDAGWLSGSEFDYYGGFASIVIVFVRV
jgi:hypothetical protein